MRSASPSSFFKQSSHIGIGTKIVNKDSIRTAIELGPIVSESSTKISKFHAPTDSEHKFHKARIENWPPIAFKLGFPWLRIHRHNYDWNPLSGSPTTGNSKFNYWNCANVPKSHSHHPEWHRPPIEQKPNTIGLIIYKHSTSTKFFHLARD